MSHSVQFIYFKLSGFEITSTTVVMVQHNALVVMVCSRNIVTTESLLVNFETIQNKTI